ncbi:type I polyketide synthase [Saccharothrix australiensis]|uniref:6-methylsalicylic acid synthase n=1 Tax=Saccharothrix australiensis TaxID=2072 RepID=A0A495W292_9PSEU|nr:type I polyketide synthase [Saccharothrix australiensis]RKT55147.1 6-methylsalicylic acid synthase [Saccharothrix australiensis]
MSAEPIAIVGMGCRLPGGVDTPAQLWDMLSTGRDGITEIPPGRWDPYEVPGTESARALRDTTRRGAFLADAAAFDADFFGVTPREAEIMDPQQRLVLEVTWEALEHAGIPPHGLAGSDTGVFVGVGSDDYGRRMLEDLPRIEAWTGIGAAPCAVANRVSYVLDLRGPSFAVDTACSSSLVAIHLAVRSLRSGETTVAIAAGVNLIAGPGLTMVLDAAGATSPDGRSKPFDSTADGYGRGEGVGVVVLKRLSDAERDGDRVLAVVRGSAVSQDGRTNGIMAPNGEAQAHVAREALRDAGLDAHDVDYVEAHGTGTRAGDPVEAAALSAVYGRSRTGDDPCLIGSIKGNIGHLEAGAGVAGVIKAVLALGHGGIPPNAVFDQPNPNIPWSTNGLRVVDAPTTWPKRGPVRRAAVSSFGYGGTVGHVVLEEAPEPAATGDFEGIGLYALSGASTDAVARYADALADWLEGEGAATSPHDLSYALLARRTHLPHRTAVAADDLGTLVARLRAVARGEEDVEGVTSGTVLPTAPADPVWVFSGHGSQWFGMGAELLAENQVFADVIAGIDPIFVAEMGFSPLEVLVTGDYAEVDRIQPMIFAVQVALAEVWQSAGLRPGAVIGHSVGEIAAAVVAGVLGVADGARLVSRRSVLLRRVAGGGAMAMLGLPFDEVRRRLGDRADVVAAIESSPLSTVVAGEPGAVERLCEQWTAEGLVVRRVSSDVAFHSPQMDPLLAELTRAADDLTVREPAVPLYTTALPDPRSTARRDGAYWAGNLRNPVLLATAVTAAAADGHRIFLEVSPHPVVAHSVGETLSELGVADSLVTGTLRRSRPERDAVRHNLALLHCAGAAVDFAGALPRGRVPSLPRVAWRHRPYWFTGSAVGRGGIGHDVAAENLLGARLDVAGAANLQVWRTTLDEDSRPYPGDHPVHGVEIVPAAVLLNTFLAAGGAEALTDVVLKAPVPVTARRELQVVRQDDTVRIASRIVAEDAGDAADQAWQTHSTATISADATAGTGFDLAEAGLRCAEVRDPGDVLDRLHAVGVADKGFPWRVDALAAGDAEVLATVRPHPDGEPSPGWGSVVDAVLTVAPLVFPGDPVLRMPAHVRRVVLTGQPPATVLVHVRLDTEDTVDVVVADEGGAVLGVLDGLRCGTLDGDRGAPVSPRRLVHRVDWRPVDVSAPRRRPLGTVVVVGPRAAVVASALEAFDVRTRPVTDLDEFERVAPDLGPGDAVLVVAGRPGPVGEAAVRASWLLARTAQLVGEHNAALPPRLWAVTTGQAESAEFDALGQAAVWGLGRIVGGEHPELWGGVVDLDPARDDLGAEGLARVLRAAADPDVFAVRGGEVLAARLATVDGEPTRPPFECRSDGTYVVTGGFGVLGLEVAAWLAGRGARRLVLVGRTTVPPRAEWDRVTDPAVLERVAAVRALEAQGVTVKPVALDVTDRARAVRLLDADALDVPPVRGVVHAAGVLDNRMLRTLDEASLRTVLAPKVQGALVLHELFPVGELDFFVLFSSVGQLLGLTGQASYASANAFLDALARHRAAQGDAGAVSLAWTSWRGMGMAVSDVVDQELRDRGVGDISAAEAFSAWEFAARHALPHAVVLRVAELDAGRSPLPVLAGLAFGAASADEDAASGDDLAALDPADLRAHLLARVAGEIGGELKIDADALDVRRPLGELGLDSVMTLSIRRRLEKRFRLSLPATLLWNHPTVTAITDYLAERLAPAGERAAGEPAPRLSGVGG